jgi:hypothetical protein
VNIEEVRKPELDSQLIADNIAAQLEKRIMFRRAMKRAMTNAMRLGAQGIKIMSAGRLNGIEIARTEWYREGRVPLHTLRADIDYGFSEAKTTYGVIGIKVWVFKGEVLGKGEQPAAPPPAPSPRRTEESGSQECCSQLEPSIAVSKRPQQRDRHTRQQGELREWVSRRPVVASHRTPDRSGAACDDAPHQARGRIWIASFRITGVAEARGGAHGRRQGQPGVLRRGDRAGPGAVRDGRRGRDAGARGIPSRGGQAADRDPFVARQLG